MDELEVFRRLGLALSIGLLLGLERGWMQRHLPEGTRIAGIRTFGLMGLLGGLWSLLGMEAGELAMAVAFLAFAGLVVTAHAMRVRNTTGSQGITSEIASMVTFALGALAVRGHMAVAAAGAVVVLWLLTVKESLHLFVARVESVELQAAVKLLLISVVMLPLLPNQGYGPGEALNPYKLWWVVVMIAGISFVGYVAIKLLGARIGTLLTGFFGGLASSTALTLNFARLGRETPELQPLLAAGVVVAAGTMFLRVLLIVVLLNPAMLKPLGLPMGVTALLSYAGALALWWDGRNLGLSAQTGISNPFELGTAVKFGLFLAVILVASRLLQESFGDIGVLALAAVSGLADVDAISVSMAKLGGQGLTLDVACAAVAIAAFVNTAIKVGIVVALCGGRMSRRVVLVQGGTCLIGMAIVAVYH